MLGVGCMNAWVRMNVGVYGWCGCRCGCASLRGGKRRGAYKAICAEGVHMGVDRRCVGSVQGGSGVFIRRLCLRQ